MKGNKKKKAKGKDKSKAGPGEGLSDRKKPKIEELKVSDIFFASHKKCIIISVTIMSNLLI